MDNIDPCCALCKNDIESSAHIFFLCSVARAIWQSACWGFRAEEVNLNDPKDIIKLILDPPKSTCPSNELWFVSLNMAVTLDEIWWLRNHVLFNGGEIDFQTPLQNILSRGLELSRIFAPKASPHSPQPVPTCSPPPLNWIKINSDAELNSSTTTLAAVARDHRGDVVKVWSKDVKVCSPIQAEASAILWAVELAIKEQWNLVCFEGDAKACFDPLSSPELPLTGLLIPSSTISVILLVPFLVAILFGSGEVVMQ